MSGADSMGPVERLAKVGARLGEAPVWLPDRKVWLWLDLYGRAVHRFDPATGTDRVIAADFAEDLAGLVRWTDATALLVSVRGFHSLSIDDGQTMPVSCPIDLPAGTIFNDGKVDRHGALWVGSSDAAEAAPLGRLWRIAKGRVTEVAAGFAVSNGPAFAPDGSAAYFADTFGRRLLRFALDRLGNPVAQSLFGTIPTEAGYPDGMTTDSAGTLYVCHWDGARISRWAPDGQALAPIPVPARNVTSLAFGGAALRTAAITTAALFPGQTGNPGEVWNGDLLSHQGPVAGLVEPMLAPDWAG
jgi:sugar lactone lactonase YvrE